MSEPVNESNLINPNNYHTFSFRGEGLANCVISAINKDSGKRIVWRFAKHDRTRIMTSQPEIDKVHNFMEKILKPYFHEEYLVETKVVEFDASHVFHLGKMGNFNVNRKIKNFEELINCSEKSMIEESDVKTIKALEMDDVIELFGDRKDKRDVFTVEIKPRQAFYMDQESFGLGFCKTCIVMIQKAAADKSERCQYCFFDLHSGDFSRMSKAIRSLIVSPNSSMKIFQNGNLIHSKKNYLEIDKLENKLFPAHQADIEDLIGAICLIISGNQSKTNFQLQETSILSKLANAEQIDSIGIVKAAEIAKSLDPEMKKKFDDPNMLAEIGLEKISEKSSKENEVRELQKYLLAGSLKDCSIMISLRFSNLFTNNTIQLPNGQTFEFLMKIVDVDPKLGYNIEKSFNVYMTGIKTIRADQESDEKDRKYSPCAVG